MTQPAMTNEEMSQLLPFWVNGSLSAAEAQAVRQALADSAALREEEQILHALHAEIRATESPASPGEFGLARLNRTLDADVKRDVAAPQRWAQASVAAALVALVAVGMLLLKSADEQSVGNDVYQQASGGAEAGQLTVAFERTATQAEVEALLLQYDLHIVDGPSALGLYQLRTGDESQLTQALAALRAADRIVETAEPTE